MPPLLNPGFLLYDTNFRVWLHTDARRTEGVLIWTPHRHLARPRRRGDLEHLRAYYLACRVQSTRPANERYIIEEAE